MDGLVKVSVVIPIYRSEGTLLRCLNSFRIQTLSDFEVLMVDDGSPDNCGRMIDEYEQQDTRFKAIHQPNGGVSSARQSGVDCAKGEYIIHADPDDWVEPDMLEKLYLKAKEEDADMVICDFYENGSQQKYIQQKTKSLDSEVLLKEILMTLHGSCSNKLIKYSCLEEYNIKFPIELDYCEDQYVIASLFKHHIKVVYLSEAFYHYVNVVEKDSLSRRYDTNSYMSDKRIIASFENLYKDTKYLKDVLNIKTFNMLTRAFYFGNDVYSSKLFANRFRKYIRYVFQVPHISLFERFLILGSCAGFYRLMFDIFTAMYKIKRAFS